MLGSKPIRYKSKDGTYRSDKVVEIIRREYSAHAVLRRRGGTQKFGNSEFTILLLIYLKKYFTKWNDEFVCVWIDETTRGTTRR
jgi:hypothetical protein